ncbi:MAG: DUF3039 domain-containing protein [Actinobacteria bacterium]|nr:DUF3039 domain-containing protein [Actinomycetota bacterium]
MTHVDVDIQERQDLRTTDEGDHERFAHIVVPASAVTEAYITGAPVTALCGKTWVPNRDPKRYPVCPTCQEVLDAARAMGRGGGQGGGGGGTDS